MKAGICKTPEEYIWSSDRSYRQNRLENVDIDFILNIFSANRKNAIEQYKSQMQIEENVIYDKLKYVGDNEFVERMEPENKKKKEQHIRQSLDEILTNIILDRNDFNLIKSGSRKRYLSSYKKEYILKAIAHGYSYREIGKNINISDSAVALHSNANNLIT